MHLHTSQTDKLHIRSENIWTVVLERKTYDRIMAIAAEQSSRRHTSQADELQFLSRKTVHLSLRPTVRLLCLFRAHGCTFCLKNRWTVLLERKTVHLFFRPTVQLLCLFRAHGCTFGSENRWTVFLERKTYERIQEIATD